MSISVKDAWTVIHGLILGTLFLVAFAGGLAGLYGAIFMFPPFFEMFTAH